MALFAMGLGVLVIANDFTALNVALPAIEEDFDVDVGTVQWTLNAYALTFGMVLVTGGRLADMFGRRRIFFIGTAIFAAFSVLGALAPSALWLIGTRVGMGVGGGLMWPAILGMTFAAVPPARAAFAGGLILGIAGLGNAVGPLIGGVLTDELSWRAIFWLNLPVAAFAGAVTWAKIHQPPPEGARQRIDYPGIVSLSLGLVLVLLALDQSADWGWGDPRVLAMLATAALSLAIFAFVEPRMGEDALVPADVIANRGFTAACITVLFLSAVFFTAVLYAPQLMEKVLGYSALEAGVGMLPMLGTFAVVAFSSNRICERFGMRNVIILGTALLALGPLLISLFDTGSRYLDLVPGLVVTGIGIGLFYPTITTAAVTMLDPSQSSLAGGIVYMFQVAGGAIGLGLATMIFTTRSEDLVVSEAAELGINTSAEAGVIHGVLAGTESGEAAFNRFGTGVADKVLEVVKDSFVAGIQLSLRVVAAIAVLGLIVAVLGVHPRDPAEAEAEAESESESEGAAQPPPAAA
jgi:EmrB/QacA subfamily drug resistance transporter